MRSTTSLGMAAVTAALFLSGPALADEPNLVGKWKAEQLHSETYAGKKWSDETSDIVFTITSQDGRILSGARHVKTAANLPTNDGSKDVTERTYDVLGVLDVDGKEIHLVSRGTVDKMYFEGDIVDENTIDMVGYEAGDKAWVTHMTLKRER